MAPKYELPTLDGLDEATAAQYIKIGDVFRFDIEGVEDVTGLKNTVEATRLERDALALKLKESDSAQKALDAEKAEAERKRLEEKGEYKTLAEKSAERELATSTELADLKAEIAENKRSALAIELTAGLTKDPASNRMLQREAMDFIKSNPEGVAEIAGPDGVTDKAKITEYLRATFPRLVDASPAGGGGGEGGNPVVPNGREYINDYTETELVGLRTSNKPVYDQVMKKGYKT